MEEFQDMICEVGTVSGLKHVTFRTRGREELVLLINTRTSQTRGPSLGNLPSSPPFKVSNAYDLPPASPLVREDELPPEMPDILLFLVCGYENYSRPLVYLRSRNMGSSVSLEQPLLLNSTDSSRERWNLIEIIREVVEKTLESSSSDTNPFEVNWDYIHSLVGVELAVVSVDLWRFLRKVFVNFGKGEENAPLWLRKVWNDMCLLLQIHVEEMWKCKS